MTDLESDLMWVIKTLNMCVWRNRVDASAIDEWLREFGLDGEAGTAGRLHALYLLSRFMYFGEDEVRALLHALHRDHYRYPILADLRRQAGDTRDEAYLHRELNAALARTRFLAMGNPSESGTHLLYHYRQENSLPSRLFISPHEIFNLTEGEPTLADRSVTRYVFIDDFCGSGVQGVRYSRAILDRIAKAATAADVTPRVEYHVLLGTTAGLDHVRQEARFDAMACVLELDETFRAFSELSRHFRNPPTGIEKDVAHDLARRFGAELSRDAPLGFADGQLLLGFIHNTPNNTLPIFWHSGNDQRTWSPPFRRYAKRTSLMPLGRVW